VRDIGHVDVIGHAHSVAACAVEAFTGATDAGADVGVLEDVFRPGWEQRRQSDDAVLTDTAHDNKVYTGKAEVRSCWSDVSGPFRSEQHR
jgi:hypothetical protein